MTAIAGCLLYVASSGHICSRGTYFIPMRKFFAHYRRVLSEESKTMGNPSCAYLWFGGQDSYLHLMIQEHRKYEEMFFRYYRMSVYSFDELLSAVCEKMMMTIMHFPESNMMITPKRSSSCSASSQMANASC